MSEPTTGHGGAPSGAPVALVTGASRGIGRGIALALAGAGWSVAVNYVRNADAAQQTAQECRDAAAAAGTASTAVPVQADVADAGDRRRLVAQTCAELGRIDLLVNNAGVAPAQRADLLEATEESFDQQLATNLRGPYFLTQLVARQMIDQPPGPVPPRIVVISSISAYTASVNRGDYCVAKAGLSMMVRLYAARLAGEGITVHEIRPGIIESDMTRGVRDRYDELIHDRGLTPIRRWGTPDDVGRAVLAVAGGLFPFSTGSVLDVDGGFHLRTL